MTGRTATCPNCGAAVVFLWSGAVQTTCEYCRSVLVRHDVELERVGVAGDVPPDSSPVQRGTVGTWRGRGFTVVGRIVYEHDRGGWNEWHLRTTGGVSAWLSDAQGDLALSSPATQPTELPPADHIQVGQSYAIDGLLFKVASLTRARYAGVEGELPFESWDRSEALFADLDSDGSGDAPRFATIDYSDGEPVAYVGEYVALEQLAPRNLRQFEGW